MANKKYIAYDDAFHALDTVAMPLSTYECLVGRFCDIPAADVAPVRHGRNESGAGFMCSVCLFRDFGVFRGYKPNFCPNCGAKMDGGEA